MEQRRVFEYYVFLPSALLSAVCAAALVVSWRLLPRWRSLQNYLGISRIIYGTLQLFLLLIEDIAKRRHPDPTNIAIKILLHLKWYTVWMSISWLNASLSVAYIRLVLRYTATVTQEKRKVTIGTHIVALILHCISETVAKVFNTDPETIMIIPWAITTTLNLFLFFKVSIVSPASYTSSSGVALLCDTLIILLIPFEKSLNKNDEIVKRFVMTLVFLSTIPQSLVLLLSRASRENWSRHLNRKERIISIVR